MKNLFKSETAYEILELLSDDNEKKWFLGEIAGALKKNSANVSRELAGLLAAKIISCELKAKKKYYFLNKNYEALPELRSLLAKNSQTDLSLMFGREWVLAEEIMNANPWIMAIPFYCFTNQFVAPGGRAYKYQACIYQGYHCWFYFDKQDSLEVGNHLVDRFVQDVNFMEQVNEKIRYFSDRLRDAVSKIPEGGLNKFSDQELWRFYDNHEKTHYEYYQWGWIPVAADMFGDQLTNRGKQVLKENNVPADKIEEYLSLLTQPEKPSMLKEEQDNLMKIGIAIQADKSQFELFKELFRKFKEEDVKFFGLYTHSEEYEEKFAEVVRSLIAKIRPDILKDLQDHYDRYFYTKFIYTEEQGTYSFEHYLKELVRMVNGDLDLASSYKKQEESGQKIMVERAALMKKIGLSEQWHRFFSAWGDFMVTKITRRYAQLFAMYKTTFLLEEIAERIGVSLKELRFMKSAEIHAALFDKKIDKDEAKARVKYSLYYTAEGQEIYYSGEKAKEIVKKYIQEPVADGVSELKGQCGCRGQARGRVKIVNVTADMSKMEKGDILVSISTQPDLLPAMKKAAAFVTDQGGVTSHAAIVAREMNMPCVIATKIATKVLKDGDLIEVDADKGLVKIIQKA